MSELYQYFTSLWHKNLFPHAWQLKTNDAHSLLDQVKLFIMDVCKQYTTVLFENNTDVILVGLDKSDANTAILIDEIRRLRNFINKKASLTPYKFAIIFQANNMNLQATNCCLKILEEPPANNFIFLLTNFANNLPLTIKSRCHKYIDKTKSCNYSYNYKSLLLDYLANPEMNLFSAILAKVDSKKNANEWLEFTYDIIGIYNIFCKLKLGLIKDFSHKNIVDKIHDLSLFKLMNDYEEIKIIIDKTILQDLDKKQATIVIMHKFAELN